MSARIGALAAVLGALTISGCGGGGSASVPSNTPPGEKLFADNCATCHTLAAAHATGTVGPNLDSKKPSAALVTERVTNGKAPMPSFKGQLSATQIADVAAYVSSVAGK